MEYKKLHDMKKEYFTFKDGRKNIVVDSGSVVSAVRDCSAFDALGGYSSGVLSHMVAGKINSFLALYPASWDMGFFNFSDRSGRKYFFDFESDKISVYDRNTGRQLYQVVFVRALRLASFAPDSGYHDKADFSEIFGRWSLGSGSYADVEI